LEQNGLILVEWLKRFLFLPVNSTSALLQQTLNDFTRVNMFGQKLVDERIKDLLCQSSDQYIKCNQGLQSLNVVWHACLDFQIPVTQVNKHSLWYLVLAGKMVL